MRLSNAIEQWHSEEGYVSTLKFDDLISQLIFMYKARWRSQDGRSPLWVVSEDGKLRRGRDVYIDLDKPSSASTLLERSRFPFLHQRILKAIPDEFERSWHNWLVESLDISIYPKLVRRIGGPDVDQFQFHNDFIHILETMHSKVILQLLRDNWNRYAKFIENDDSIPAEMEPNPSRTKVRQFLQRMEVKCTDGLSRQLCTTFLPLQELEKIASGCIPFVDVPNPDHYSWRITLHCLGVGWKDDLTFYVTCLQGLKGQEDPSNGRICTLLEQIQARSGDDREGIR